MAYIAVASAKGSPGVTTAIAALAATWPADRELLVAELDPAGGDLVVRFDLATEPGLVTLAAAGRRELTSETVLAHTQALPVATEGEGEPPARRVLLAPVSAEQASASLSALRGGLARALSGLPFDVLIDCGRLDPSSTTYDVASNADLLVAVARPVVAEVHHLSSRLMALKPAALSLLMIGDRPYSATDVARAVGATALGTLPVDPRAAAVLTEGHPNAVRVLRRSRLLRDARPIAEALAGWLGPAGGAAGVAAGAHGAPGPGSATSAPPAAPAQPSAPAPSFEAPAPPSFEAPAPPSFEAPSREVGPAGEAAPSPEPVAFRAPVPPYEAPPVHEPVSYEAPPVHEPVSSRDNAPAYGRHTSFEAAPAVEPPAPSPPYAPAPGPGEGPPLRPVAVEPQPGPPYEPLPWAASYAPPPAGPAHALPPPLGATPTAHPAPAAGPPGGGDGGHDAAPPPPSGVVARLRPGGRGAGRDKAPKHFRRDDDEGRR